MRSKNIVSVVAAAVALVCSCTEHIVEVVDSQEPTYGVSEVSATISDIYFGDETKSEISATGSFTWETDDELSFWPKSSSLFSGSPSAVIFRVKEGGASTATFVGNGWALSRGNTYYASYPYSASDKYNQVTINYLGQNQSENGSSAHLGQYDYLHAVTTVPSEGSVNMSFDRIGCLAKITLSVPDSGSGTKFHKVTLVSDGELFASSATYDPSAASVSLSRTSSSMFSITLNGSEGFAPTDGKLVIYAMVAPVSWSGETITVLAIDENDVRYSGTFTPTKNQVAGHGYSYSATLSVASVPTIAFVDSAVKVICVSLWDTDGDGELSYEEAAAVTELPYSAFYGNKTIKSFDEFQYFTSCTSLKSERESVSDDTDFNGAFEGCTNLKSITLPASLKTIGYNAFRGCTALEEIVIPASVTKIKDYAFVGDPQLIVTMESSTPVALTKYSSSDVWYYSFGYSGGTVKVIYVPTVAAETAYKASAYYELYKPIIHVYGYPLPETDLSANGTANSYIVTRAGSYKIKAVQGNTSNAVSASTAEVLWESFGTSAAPSVGDLVSDVAYADGYVSFTASDKKGNAVIAVRDFDGNISWSWHIWMTDKPVDQVYNNGAGIMLDRNLGATSAVPGDAAALGLMYQWGRKDPFRGSYETYDASSDASLIATTSTWPDAIASSLSVGTIGYAIQHPTTFIVGAAGASDWMYAYDVTRWASAKTSYDPCPVGYRVPDGGSESIWTKACGDPALDLGDEWDGDNYGFDFGGENKTFGSSEHIWYPVQGNKYAPADGRKYGRISYPGSYCRYLTCTPVESTSYAYALYLRGGNVSMVDNWSRANGGPVRCVKE